MRKSLFHFFLGLFCFTCMTVLSGNRITCMAGACGGQKSGSYPLGLALQRVVSHHTVLSTRPSPCLKNSSKLILSKLIKEQRKESIEQIPTEHLLNVFKRFSFFFLSCIDACELFGLYLFKPSVHHRG